MSDEDLLSRWRAIYAAPAEEGWDFSEFDGRIEESDPPWSYADLAREALIGAGSVLDLGTGGGELLLTIRDALPDDTHATEGWPPNLPVARRVLATLGIEVADHDAARDAALPYPDDRFDVVLTRHEAYVADEVRRVLRPGGVFVTQQVDGRNLADLGARFGIGPAYPHITLADLRREAEGAGLGVDLAQDWTGPIRFADVDTLVSYLRRMPWQLPDDFTVDRYADQLLHLHRSERPLVFTEGRFLLVCRAPGAG